MGRSPSHRKAMLRNLACSLILTERDAEFEENPPKVKGRVVTTIDKAKEVRPLVEKCVTIARRALPSLEAAEQHETEAERNSEEWRAWRKSDRWHDWNQAIAPALAARRRVASILGDKEAVQILFEDIAPRYVDRPGGYTRIVRLATPRLGDAGTQAILEFVGKNDRERQRSEAPTFTDDEPAAAAEDEPEQQDAEAAASETAPADVADAGDDTAEERDA